MQRFNARWLGLLAITLIAIYLCWLIIAPFVTVILWAVVLAVLAYPYYHKMRMRGMNATLAALIATLGVVVIVLLPVLGIVVALAAQIPTWDQAQEWILQAKQLIAQGGWVHRHIDPYVDIDWLSDMEIVKQRLKPLAASAAQQTVDLATSLAGTTVEIVFALFTLFYFLKDNRAIGDTVFDFLPLEKEQSQAVFVRCQQILQASVQGVILIAAIQGALGALAFWALGVPSPILWGVIMFVLSMIPALGAFLVWVPAALFLGATGHWGKAIALVVWGGAVIGSVDNFLRPRLVGKKTGMHDLVIFFSVLGGLQVFGILGLFVGPVVVAIALSIVEVFKEASVAWREPPKAPVIAQAPDVAVQAGGTNMPQHPMDIDPPR